MKILHIDETFHPAFGYQCNPLAKFQAKEGHQVQIITVEPKHLYPVYREFGDDGSRLTEQDFEYEKKTGVRVVRVPARGYVARRLVYDYKRLFQAIDEAEADVMLVHCLETLTAVRVLFKYDGVIPMVFDSHMLTMASKNPLAPLYEKAFKRFVTPKIISSGIPVIKTQDDPYVTDKLGVPSDLTTFISFGTDTDLFVPNEMSRIRFINEHDLDENSFILVSTGKLSEPKGGMLLAQAVKRGFDSTRPVVLVVVANLDGEYESRVRELLDQSENKVIYYPVQNYCSLPYFYQIADACIFPRQCSMSFYDAQACGVPVISEDNNINIARNSKGNGICFEQGNEASIRDAIARLANMSKDDAADMRNAARNYVLDSYSYENISKQYSDVLMRRIDSEGHQ